MNGDDLDDAELYHDKVCRHHGLPGAGMSEDPEATHERAAVQHMMRRLDGFARGLGLDEASTRQIVEKVVADMPVHTDEERLAEARARLIAALASR